MGHTPLAGNLQKMRPSFSHQFELGIHTCSMMMAELLRNHMTCSHKHKPLALEVSLAVNLLAELKKKLA